MAASQGPVTENAIALQPRLNPSIQPIRFSPVSNAAAALPELSGLERLESLEMTLARGQFVTFDYNRMVVMFTMMDGETDVPCAISTTAMDDLDKTREAKTPAQREEQFLRLRDQIESRAARKFLDVGREGNPPGLILRSIDFTG